MSSPCTGVYGEVLFDHFPDGRRVLGGAPFNVAWHLQAFGARPLFISRVGDDPEGVAVLRAMQEWGMDTGMVQTDAGLPTGRVTVRLVAGEPEYDIMHPAAFDAIAPVDDAPLLDMLYHGTLALRDRISRNTLERIRAARPARVFVDVNLRPPWWQPAQVLGWLEAAHWVKLNRAELEALGGGNARESDALRFMDRHGLDGLVVTRGGQGAAVYTAGGKPLRVAPRENIRIIDTVGAGDAFAAVMLFGLGLGWPLEVTLERAQDFAARLCGHRGATVRDPAFYRGITQKWQSKRATRHDV